MKNKIITILSVLAALAYNSWVLGFWLNPVMTSRSVASELEETGQAYAWVFVGLDVLTCVFVIMAAFLLARRGLGKSGRLALAGMALFGSMTALSALIPVNCSDMPICGTHLGTLSIHDLASALAALGQCIALLFAWLYARRQAASIQLGWLLIAWTLLGLMFGFYFFNAIRAQPWYMTAAIDWQRIFLILSGLGIVLANESLKSPRSKL